jgi:hypothetical protein
MIGRKDNPNTPSSAKGDVCLDGRAELGTTAVKGSKWVESVSKLGGDPDDLSEGGISTGLEAVPEDSVEVETVVVRARRRGRGFPATSPSVLDSLWIR